MVFHLGISWPVPEIAALYSLSNGCRCIVAGSGAVSGKRRVAAAVSGTSRRDRREHRGRSERSAKADRVPAGPFFLVPRFRGLLLCAGGGHRQPDSSPKPTGRSALGRGIPAPSGFGFA